jgi:hypothetical protein
LAAASPEQRELAERVRSERDDVAHKVIQEEIRPVVRESITEDTLKAIRDMVALTPATVAAIQEDLQSEDAVVRQRAYTLILKYTVGHQAIVRPPDEDRTQPITVNFQLDRPPQADAPDLPEQAEPVESTAVEVKTCDMCGKEDTADKFAANSTRCLSCYDKQRRRADEFLSDHAGD